MQNNKIIIKLIKSPIATTENIKSNIRGLGLTKIGSQRELVNTSAVRGMIKKVIHFVEIIHS